MNDFELTGLRAVIIKVTGELGLRLYDFEFNDVARVLKVLIDKTEGVTLGDCTRASAALSRELDQLDLIRGRYHLEVSSPGINRPLKRLEHYQWAIGKMVTVETGRRTVTGYLRRADEQSVMIATPAGEDTIPFAEIAKAKVNEEITHGKRR